MSFNLVEYCGFKPPFFFESNGGCLPTLKICDVVGKVIATCHDREHAEILVAALNHECGARAVTLATGMNL